MKVYFLTRSLYVGGAERQLVLLASQLKSKGHDVRVILFYLGGELESELKAQDVPVLTVHKRGRWDNIGFLIRLIRFLKQEKPDVVYSFLVTSNIISGLVKLLVKDFRVVWGVRAAGMNLGNYDWVTRCTGWIEERLAHVADAIICNSFAGKQDVISRGFPSSRVYVIPNGINTEVFKPKSEYRHIARERLGITESKTVIGVVARLDPIKDHTTLLRATKVLCSLRDDIVVICIGDGESSYKEHLISMSQSLGLENIVQWLGTSADMPLMYASMDIVCSCSSSEGFSNVIGEAMAMGLPCVVTDVGDSAVIVGENGLVVPSCNVEALVSALDSVINEITKFSHDNIRTRIETFFSIENMVGKTENVLIGKEATGQ